MIIRIRYQKRGAHIHCRLFTAKAKNMTFAKSGDLVFAEAEWNDVRDMLHSAIEFLEEDSSDVFAVDREAVLRGERDRLRAALIKLVGAEDTAELEAMEMFIRMAPAPAEDKAATIDAIHALLAIR